ncbi:MAG: hypothetical protein M1820_006094 [Bogoriella megaspora]|nr:MAG: hypothetical protein M1820_006094 [Bogoriella megaspora]
MVLLTRLYFLVSLLPLALAATSSGCTFATLEANGTLSDCSELCRPAKWNEILIFFLGNYLAHAVTVRSFPGQPTVYGLAVITAAALFPFVGIATAVQAIVRRLAGWGKSPLQKAAGAGALYMVVENHSETGPKFGIQVDTELATIPPTGPAYGPEHLDTQTVQSNNHRPGSAQSANADRQSNDTSDQHSLYGTHVPGSLSLKRRDSEAKFNNIHGRVCLPVGWELKRVPVNWTFKNDNADGKATIAPRNMQLAQDFSFAKAAIGLGQALYAFITLYGTSHKQIQKFGYATFRLTVIPYGLMSIMNFIASLVSSSYSAVYIVENDILSRLKARIASEGKQAVFYVEGAVAELEMPEPYPKERSHVAIFVFILTVIVLFAVQLAVIGGLTRFHNGDSSEMQSMWMVTWLVLNFLISLILGILLTTFIAVHDPSGQSMLILMLTCVVGTPAIAGFVVVGQMLSSQYGVCNAA